VHKKGLELLNGNYASEADAGQKIPAALQAFYSSQHSDVTATKSAQIKAAADELVTLYSQNVFPYMKVTWGTHPNHIGHMSYPGCFRCHDGSHNAKDGKSITNDCAACHNLVAIDEPNPKQLTEIGMQ
jgi:hypothetical protein